MKKAASSITAIGLVFAAASAAAQSTDTPAVYGGISIGSAKAECTGAPASMSCDGTGGALKFFGGYQFHRHFAIELGAGAMGEWTARGPAGVVEMSAVAVEALGVGIMPLGEQFALFGKAGLYRATLHVRASMTTVVGNFDESNLGLTGGFGARFDFARNFGVRLEWQRYFDVGDGNIPETDVDAFTVGVQLRF